MESVSRPDAPGSECKVSGQEIGSNVVRKGMWPSAIANLFLILAQMSSEQLGQLYELMHAAKDVWKPIQMEGGEEEGKS